MKVLVIDNFDSFVYNIVQAIEAMGNYVRVVDNQSLPDASGEEYSHIIISPGPGNPVNIDDTGNLYDFMKSFPRSRFLGICFGHQFLAHYLGAKIYVGNRQLHGEIDTIQHGSSPVYRGIPRYFKSIRYHSLSIYPSKGIIVDALSKSDGSVMGFHDSKKMIFGVQFHPESHYSEFGNKILENFLAV